MDTLYLEGVRCFREATKIPLAPITLLVGENSSGKSSALALSRVAWDACSSLGTIDFNQDPFELGTWESIAHYHGGQAKRVLEIRVGLELADGVSVHATFVQAPGGEPAMSRWHATGKPGSVEFVLRGEQSPSVSLTTPGKERRQLQLRELPAGARLDPMSALLLERPGGEVKGLESLLTGLHEIFLTFRRTQRPEAIAPIRSRPRRTYDPVRTIPTPEGEHVPALLSRLRASEPEGWERLSTILDKFGHSSGLFDELVPQHLGDRKSGPPPFQIKVGVANQIGRRNLVDVGYGVSQVLPVLVESALHRGGTLLVQQPEVHLHPRAQAELGTFFVQLHQDTNTRFVIETHSDHLVDRVRSCIRDGAIKAEDVALVYFERLPRATKSSGTAGGASGVRTHRIDLDAQGEIVSPPETYREFFLREQLRNLGAGDVHHR